MWHVAGVLQCAAAFEVVEADEGDIEAEGAKFSGGFAFEVAGGFGGSGEFGGGAFEG